MRTTPAPSADRRLPRMRVPGRALLVIWCSFVRVCPGLSRCAGHPAATWEAILSHVRDPADATRLADSARARLLYRYAIPLYRRAADAGDRFAASQLADLLAARNDLDELRARADVGDR